MGTRTNKLIVTPKLMTLSILFTAVLITSNIVAVKLVEVLGYVLPAAIIIFPLSYIIGDVLTEVYGFRTARRVIWIAFFCNLIAVSVFWLGSLLPPIEPEIGEAYDRILGYTPRLLGASFVAYLGGEFTNAFILSRMKIITRGKWLWSRTIGSTIIGQGIDTLLFISLAFTGTVPPGLLVQIIIVQWFAKVAYEIVATPVTYKTVGYLKRSEGIDAYGDAPPVGSIDRGAPST